MQYGRQDIEVVVSLPENSPGYLTSKFFKADEREQVSCNEQRLYTDNLIKSLTEDIDIKKQLFAEIFCVKTKTDIEIKHETQTKKASHVENFQKEHKGEVVQTGMTSLMLASTLLTRWEKSLLT